MGLSSPICPTYRSQAELKPLQTCPSSQAEFQTCPSSQAELEPLQTCPLSAAHAASRCIPVNQQKIPHSLLDVLPPFWISPKL